MANPLHTQFIHMLTSLTLMIGAILLLAYLYKKFALKSLSRQSELKILSTLGLGNKEKLILVQVGEQQLLLGATSTQINTLYELKEPIDFHNKPASQSRIDFKKLLEGLKK